MPHSQPEPSPEQRFGRAVRAARESLGWSQEALVQRLEAVTGVRMHQTGLARLESGARGIRLDEAVAIARFLDLDLNLISVGNHVPTAADVWAARAAVREAQSLQYAADLAVMDAQKRLEDAQARYTTATARLHALSAAWSAARDAGSLDPVEADLYDRWEREEREEAEGLSDGER